MQITRSSADSATSKGPAEWFTGDVYIDPLAVWAPPSRAQANLVLGRARQRRGVDRRRRRHQPGVGSHPQCPCVSSNPPRRSEPGRAGRQIRAQLTAWARPNY
jgi:hypothetical protein